LAGGKGQSKKKMCPSKAEQRELLQEKDFLVCPSKLVEGRRESQGTKKSPS